MNGVDILKTGYRARNLIRRTSRERINKLKAAFCPTKIFYLWEKRGIKRIELFSME